MVYRSSRSPSLIRLQAAEGQQELVLRNNLGHQGGATPSAGTLAIRLIQYRPAAWSRASLHDGLRNAASRDLDKKVTFLAGTTRGVRTGTPADTEGQQEHS